MDARTRTRALVVAVSILTLVLASATGLEERFEAAQLRAFAPGWEEAIAAQTHLGAGPCRRWMRPADVPPEEPTRVAEELVALGLVPRSFDVLALAWTCLARLEAKAHATDDRAEVQARVMAELSPIDRLWFRAVGRQHLEALTVDLSETQAELRRQAEVASTRLSPEVQGRLQALCESEPRVYSRAGLTRLFPAARRVLTGRRLRALGALMRVRSGTGTPSLEELEDPDGLLDAWGRALVVESSTGGIVLRSLGADGARGGRGDEADLVERVR